MASVPVTLAPGPPPRAGSAALLLQAAGAAKCAACGCAHETSAALNSLPATAPAGLRDAARRLAASLTGQRYPAWAARHAGPPRRWPRCKNPGCYPRAPPARPVTDPVLVARAAAESRYLGEVVTRHASRLAIVPDAGGSASRA